MGRAFESVFPQSHAGAVPHWAFRTALDAGSYLAAPINVAPRRTNAFGNGTKRRTATQSIFDEPFE